MPVHPFHPRRRRSGGEQLSPIEDGIQVFDQSGLCRFEIRNGNISLGALVLTSNAPISPYQATKDHWKWNSGVTPWPNHFELHFAPGLTLASGSGEVHPQVVFSGSSSQRDLSSSTLKVWRVRLGEMVQGVPVFSNVGHLTRNSTGALHWYADNLPTNGVFGVDEGQWLEFNEIDNTNLQVSAVGAVLGSIV